MEELITILCDFVKEYGMYIGLAIMLGVNKAVYEIDNKGLPFSFSNLLKYSVVFAIIAPLKIGSDMKNQYVKQQEIKKEKNTAMENAKIDEALKKKPTD